MTQGRSTKFISMIKWIRTNGLSKKHSRSLKHGFQFAHANHPTCTCTERGTPVYPIPFILHPMPSTDGSTYPTHLHPPALTLVVLMYNKH